MEIREIVNLFKLRLKRSKREANLKVLSHDAAHYDFHHIGCDFIVRGKHVDEGYLVRICNNTSCNCTDFVSKCLLHDMPCKHILFVILKHLGYTGDESDLMTLKYSDDWISSLLLQGVIQDEDEENREDDVA